MKRLILALIIALPFLLLSEETATVGSEFLTEEVLKAINNTPAHSQFPDAKACYLFRNDEYTIKGDGSWSRDVHYLLRLYTYKGKREYSNFKFNYDTTFQRYEIIEARSINPEEDGGWKVSPIPNHSINEITPPHLTGATDYARKKQLVLSIPAVTETSWIEIKVRFEGFDKPSVPFGGNFTLVEDDPVLWRDMSIYSRDIELKYESMHGAPEVEIFNDTLHWIIEDYKGMTPEGSMPRISEFMPTVTISTQENWTAATGYFAKGFLPKAIVTEDIENKVKEIAGDKTGEEALWSIAQFVSDEIKKYDVPLADVDYAPKSADEVLKSGSGDSREIAVLMMAMLKAKDIEAYPVLVPKQSVAIRENVPTIAQFDRVALQAKVYEKPFFIDPMQEDCMQGHLGELEGGRGLLVKLGGYEFVDFPKPNPDENKIQVKYLCQLNEDGDLKGWAYVKGWGEFDCDIRNALKDKSPRKMTMIMEDIVSGIKSGAKLLKDSTGVLDDPTVNSSFSFRFEAEDFASVQKDMMIFEFPGNPVNFTGVELPTSLKERDNPIWFDYPFTYEMDYTITIPDGYEMAFLTPTANSSNEIGEVNLKSTKQGSKVTFTRTMKIAEKSIAPEDYPKLKEIGRAWRTPRNKLLLLEEKGE